MLHCAPSLLTLSFVGNWAYFTVISEEVQIVYGLDKSTVQLQTLWSQICFVPAAFTLSCFPKHFSSRRYITIASTLICIGSILKAITTMSPYSLIFAHVAQISNGIAAPFVFCTPSLISSDWFPINQRSFATSLAISANYLGISL